MVKNWWPFRESIYCMLANDTLLFLNEIENQFQYVFDILQAFGRILGC